ncbi:MAG: hypothetical protein AAF447_06490 [Myxococcota bacterium]
MFRTLLVAVMLSGCTATVQPPLPPWEQAAPDGSALALRIDEAEWTRRYALFEVGFDGRYLVLADRDREVCRGVLSASQAQEVQELVARQDFWGTPEDAAGGVVCTGCSSTRITLASSGGNRHTTHWSGGGWLPNGYFARFEEAVAFARGMRDTLGGCRRVCVDELTLVVVEPLSDDVPSSEGALEHRITHDATVVVRLDEDLFESARQTCRGDTDELRRRILQAALTRDFEDPLRVVRPGMVRFTFEFEAPRPNGETEPRRFWGFIDPARAEHAAWLADVRTLQSTCPFS